jgi:hypothetical protein
VEKEKHVPDEDHEDTAASPTAPGKVVASEERHIIEDEVLLAILAPPFQQSMLCSIW